MNRGFTLLEISIVIVIIGLLAGGILVGRDMMEAAEIRATITQIEKYNTATRTFMLKYNALPGDMPPATAAAIGFKPRGVNPGQGDGDGVLAGSWVNGTNSRCDESQSSGEVLLFWADLSQDNLIEGGFTDASADTPATYEGSDVARYMPKAKLGGDNYIYVYNENSVNHYGILAKPRAFAGVCGPSFVGTRGLSAMQAYNMDVKMDDGMPQTGNVMARALNGYLLWAGTDPGVGTAASNATCYDNDNGALITMRYTLNMGTAKNCYLGIKFQ